MDMALAVSPGGLLYRRPAAPELRLLHRDPSNFLVANAFHEVSGDLTRGIVLQANRGPDGKLGPSFCHSGNLLEFRYRGRAWLLDVEDHIADAAILRLPGRVILRHESNFSLPVGLLGRPRPGALRLRYEYAILADSPVLELTVTLLPAPGIRLTRPRITSALDNLSPEAGVGVRRMLAWTETGRSGTAPRAGKPGETALLHLGQARHLAFPSEGAPEEGLACHLRLNDGSRLVNVKGSLREDGRLHWAVLRYGAAMLRGPEAMVIREERLLSAEGGAADLPDATPVAVAAALAAAPALQQPEAAASLPAPHLSTGPERHFCYLGTNRALAMTRHGDLIYLDTRDIGLTPHIAQRGFWEAEVEAVLTRLLRPGQHVVEVGANMGYHTLVMARAIGPQGKLHAFEVNPEALSLLTATVSVNGLGDRVTVHPQAALDRKGAVEFAADPRFLGSGHLVLPDEAANYSQRFSAPGVTLDEALADRLGQIDLLRMDAEGSEPKVLRGAERLLRASAGLRIVTEWAPPMMAERADVSALVAWLGELGFRAWRIGAVGHLAPVPAAQLPALAACELVFSRDEPG